MPNLNCNTTLRKLMESAIYYEDYQKLVNYINALSTTPDWDFHLWTMTKLREEYRQSLVALHKELVPNYISTQDIYFKLWELFKEITLNANQYQIEKNLDRKLSEFCGDVKKPLTPYDIIYEIKYFDIGESAFTFGNVDLFKLDAERLVKMRLIKNTSVVKDTVFGEWVGKSVIKTEVSISELDRAYESGLNTVSNVLDAIRLVAVWGRLNKLNGELFLWELGKSMTIPKEVNYEGMVVRTTYHRGFRPLIIPMDETIKKGLNDQKAWNHLFDESLPEDIYTCLSRAIKWITQAVTTNGLDFKIVYLCTALEIMLLPEYKQPPKGARLALRHVLLGHGNGLTPEAVLHLYDKRSSIIHDGSLEITDYSAYLNLLIG